MAEVHPTAIVDDDAQLADDVVIGPWCWVRGRVRIDAGTVLLQRVMIRGPVTIGRENTLYPNATIGYAPQDQKYDPAADGAGVVIGDGNTLREGVTIHRATGEQPTRLGDHNYLMVNSHVGHDSVLHNRITLINGAVVAGHVELADQVIIGGIAGVHQFCRVGRGAMLGGGIGITKDLPPWCVAYEMRTVGSLNLVGLRRAGLRDSVRPMKKAFDILFRAGHNRPHALQRIRAEIPDDPVVAEFADFVQTSTRGICTYYRAHEPRDHESTP